MDFSYGCYGNKPATLVPLVGWCRRRCAPVLHLHVPWAIGDSRVSSAAWCFRQGSCTGAGTSYVWVGLLDIYSWEIGTVTVSSSKILSAASCAAECSWMHPVVEELVSAGSRCWAETALALKVWLWEGPCSPQHGHKEVSEWQVWRERAEPETFVLISHYCPECKRLHWEITAPAAGLIRGRLWFCLSFGWFLILILRFWSCSSTLANGHHIIPSQTTLAVLVLYAEWLQSRTIPFSHTHKPERGKIAPCAVLRGVREEQMVTGGWPCPSPRNEYRLGHLQGGNFPLEVLCCAHHMDFWLSSTWVVALHAKKL